MLAVLQNWCSMATVTAVVVVVLLMQSAKARPADLTVEEPSNIKPIVTYDTKRPYFIRSIRRTTSKKEEDETSHSPFKLSNLTTSILSSGRSKPARRRNTSKLRTVKSTTQKSYLRSSDRDAFKTASPGLTFDISIAGGSTKSTNPKKATTSRKTSNIGKTLDQQEDAPEAGADVIRPLENMADRFLQSQTVSVVDSIAAQAIETFARLVDGAGVALVDIIDNLPTTIDRVADTVDGMVRTADNIGRGVAVIVTAPARVVLTGLNPAYQDRFTRENPNIVDEEANAIIPSPPERALDSQASTLWTSFEQRNNIRRNSFNDDQNIVNFRNMMNFRRNRGSTISESLENFNNQENVVKAITLGTTKATPTTSSSILQTNSLGLFGELRNQRRALAQISETPFSSTTRLLASVLARDPSDRNERLLSPIITGFGSLGGNLLMNFRNNRRNDTDDREKSVFERNFEASRTQASINKLEDEFGGFLGRLLGTIYRNADPIDQSISGGIRRVLGTAPSAPTTTTPGPSTKPPVQFRLTFDDIDPAPARNSASTGP